MGALLTLLVALVPSGTCELSGRVRFVDSVALADHVVRFVDGPADLRVRFVRSLPMHGGEWQEVTAGEIADFTVYAAGDLEPADFTARKVDWRPGCQM